MHQLDERREDATERVPCSPTRAGRFRSLRWQLLLALNVPLLTLAGVYLAYDFQRELADRTKEKWVALDEEAKTILPAIDAIRDRGSAAIQAYIDSVCIRMKDRDSPGHHIAAVVGDITFQARAHHRASAGMVAAMQRGAASTFRTAKVDGKEIIVGRQIDGDTTVLISEETRLLKLSVLRHLAGRIVGFLVLLLVAGAVINVVVMRLVTRPIGRLVRAVRRLAAGQLGTCVEPGGAAEFDYLATEINQLSESLDTAERYRSMQMRRAREIQQHALPRKEAFQSVRIVSAFFPADEVGGDYYDVVEMPDGSTLLCIADVAGHGVAAAMLALLLRSLLHLAVDESTRLPEIMQSINRRFAEASLPGDFATVALVQIRPNARKLEFASAGHEPCWILPEVGDPIPLESTGLILGIDAGAQWEVREHALSDGDWLALLTDGVTETLNETGELFGRERLMRLLLACRRGPMNEAAERIRSELQAFRGKRKPTDDVTVLLASLHAPTQA